MSERPSVARNERSTVKSERGPSGPLGPSGPVRSIESGKHTSKRSPESGK
jgi:hypothetical protein